MKVATSRSACKLYMLGTTELFIALLAVNKMHFYTKHERWFRTSSSFVNPKLGCANHWDAQKNADQLVVSTVRLAVYRS